MISREELKAYESVVGFNLWQLERDYLQHLLLLFLSQKTKKELVFKGGTALQKTFGLNRFSIDLDFTMTDKIGTEEVFLNVAKDITRFGFDAVLKKVEDGKRGMTIKVGINGPLYEGAEKTSTMLRIEISRREDVFLEALTKEITPLYADLRPYYVLCMDPREILAEKVRAIIGRRYARDVYDRWFLLKKGTEPDLGLINGKLEYYKKTFNAEEFSGKVKEKEDVWESELKPIIMGRLPDFGEAFKAIKEKFKSLGKT